MGRIVIAISVLFSFACYHATVDTGRAPNGVLIEKKWANSFVYGLVPPAVVETASKCPDGLATVDTQLSFLNQLVSFLTIGIYTPMEIVVACAGATTSTGDSKVVTSGSSRDSRVAAVEQAVELSISEQSVVYVKF